MKKLELFRFKIKLLDCFGPHKVTVVTKKAVTKKSYYRNYSEAIPVRLHNLNQVTFVLVHTKIQFTV